MKKDWLWDRKTSETQALRILRNTDNPDFISLSGILLARKNEPREVFRDYLKPDDFYLYWPKIKRKMRKDAWNNPRIEFWQAVYEKLSEKYRDKGIGASSKYATAVNEFCLEVGRKLRDLRRENGFTQEAFAKRINVSQQMISRIERGQENASLLTLKRVLNGLGVQLSLMKV